MTIILRHRRKSILQLCLVDCLAGLLLLACGGCYDNRAVTAFLRNAPQGVTGVEYRMLPPDVLTFHSRHILEIDNYTEQIRPDGKLNVPLVGEVQASGRTAVEVEKEVMERARKFYDEVDVTCQISQYRSQMIYVFGQVAKAGPTPWTGHDTLLSALAEAQPTFLAWPERILLVRGGPPQEGGRGDGAPSRTFRQRGVHPEFAESADTMVFNLRAMIQKGDMSANVLLMPNDVIYVQAHPMAKAGLMMQSLLLPVTPVAQAAMLPYYFNGSGNR